MIICFTLPEASYHIFVLTGTVVLGRHNAIGFNNYPDDKPYPPYFTGWLGYLIREGFVRLLASAVQHGVIVWPGKRRYESAQHRQQAKAKKNSTQLDRVG